MNFCEFLREHTMKAINFKKKTIKLLTKKQQKSWKCFLISASTITGCVSISAFASLIGIPTGITSFAIGLKICAITAGIKRYKSIIKKKKKKHDKRVLLAKSKLNRVKVVFSKSLIDSNISHDELVLINSVLKEYDEVKEEIKNLKTKILVYS